MTKTSSPGRYGAVLFDLDGTLLDTAPDFITALNLMLGRHRLEPLDPGLIRATVSHGSAALVTLGFGLQPHDDGFEALRQEFLGHYMKCLAHQTRLFPGMEVVLRRLATAGIPWGIVTNKPELYTRAILDQLWLPSAPAAVVCPDHVANTKPHPESVLLACTTLDRDPRQTLMVGDHLRDIEAGAKAGCHTVTAAYGYIDGEDQPASWGAHHLINHASELESIVFPP